MRPDGGGDLVGPGARPVVVATTRRSRRLAWVATRLVSRHDLIYQPPMLVRGIGRSKQVGELRIDSQVEVCVAICLRPDRLDCPAQGHTWAHNGQAVRVIDVGKGWTARRVVRAGGSPGPGWDDAASDGRSAAPR